MTDADDTAPDEPARDARPYNSQVRLAIALVVGGVLLIVVPGLLRDGVCGLVVCADVTPDIGVGRPTGTDLAVVIPADAADELQSLRLFAITGQATNATAGEWIVYRSDDSSAPTLVPFGEQPEGFETRTELAEQPSDGLWVMEASFGCSSTLVRFAPSELDPGYVTTGDGPVTIAEFEDTARSSLRCATEAPPWQRWLFIIGVILASCGAVLGLVAMFRRPPPDESDWYGP